MFPHRFATFNQVWASLLLEELYRLGVRDLALAPGSRSSPLTMAAAAHAGFRRHPHFDERGLGFMALGLARGSGRPVAVITTSGTAVANLYPAVIEARQSGIPLILLSADRPVELIDNGSNQAIVQAGIFAEYPVYRQDLPSPTPAVPAAFVLSSVDQALARQALEPGPVHLNCPFPEPLYPGGEPFDAVDYLAPLGRWRQDHSPWSPWQRAEARAAIQPDWAEFSARRGLVVAGQIDDPAEARAVATLARQLGWPLLADLQSQLRFDEHNLLHADLALHSPAFRRALAEAEVLLQFGGRLISKRFGHFIAGHDWRHYWLVESRPCRLDPDYRVRRRLLGSPADFVRRHPAPGRSPWHRLEPLHRPVASLLAQRAERCSELGICHRLNRLLRGRLMVGNSMAARLLNMAGSPGPGPTRVMANRGASGIDGLIATAYGFAQSGAEPTTLVLGDISALHDLNSLALLGRSRVPLVLILLNNNGGGIFNLLPVPEEDGLLEEYYRLPHGLDFARAAALFGLSYAAPASLAEFDRTYRRALDGGATLIEVRVPERQLAEDLRWLEQRLHEA
ncbi:2-succinyl-5-enolpyruvyl-6-hydroxy-3-cyclohexene-1-carboxylic-acid synthase [Zobellella denitrificans]|uniref:2-succinyl-5-enolpyruvyl-6-hydroxy-3- cyclohexene-1-carboxylic-acid synthase n=1 Tax=Zobellella denitrificans TaxID=347534 RepID=UPI000B8C5DC1|nr:2-succinyl-5-enolpyruvyl-6-hydroxy-3-cyclohexene-1-carboxylic-acid synthase [Zobellella denitrificans]OXS13555.1 2-succinyl-5-enolpyruvyl-6-hydroxy-3-cyclohexene-1-carboxylic-acid synthase [Zobellella denitrificans]